MKIRYGYLTKIKGNGKTNLRTPSMEGCFYFLPEEGKRFKIFGDPLTKGMQARIIDTSIVQSTKRINKNCIGFETVNSVYELEVFDHHEQD